MHTLFVIWSLSTERKTRQTLFRKNKSILHQPHTFSHLEFEFRTALNVAKSQVFLGKRPSNKEARGLKESQFVSLSLFAPLDIKKKTIKA